MDKEDKALIGVYILFIAVCSFGWVIDTTHTLGRTILRIAGMLLPLAGWFIYRLVVKFRHEDDQWNKYHGTDIYTEYDLEMAGGQDETKQ